MRILTVDDSRIVRKIIKTAIQTLEMEQVEAENAVEALEELEKFDGCVDLILLDWNMPGMDGLELLKIIKGEQRYYNIPIMMVTTESSSENIRAAIKAGASHYMIKPFSIEELIKRILECLGRWQA